MMSSGRAIIITGVSSGLGHGLAKHYLERKAKVYGISRRMPTDLIEAGLVFRTADLRDHGATASAVRNLLANVPHLDLAILNAGVLSPFGDLADRSLSELKAVTEVNLWANKTIMDALFDDQRQVTQVVAISSGASVNGNRGWNGYSISKAALNMLIKLYAAEHLATHFCALAPGLIDTAMQEALCGLPADDRFPALDALKSQRGTEGMPDGATAARRIAQAIERLPVLVTSGAYADVRKPPLST